MYKELLTHVNTCTMLQTNIRGYQFQLSQLYCLKLTNMYNELLTHMNTFSMSQISIRGDQVKQRNYAQKSDPTIHMKTHTGEKPCWCTQRGKAVEDIILLTDHTYIKMLLM